MAESRTPRSSITPPQAFVNKDGPHSQAVTTECQGSLRPPADPSRPLTSAPVVEVMLVSPGSWLEPGRGSVDPCRVLPAEGGTDRPVSARRPCRRVATESGRTDEPRSSTAWVRGVGGFRLRFDDDLTARVRGLRRTQRLLRELASGHARLLPPRSTAWQRLDSLVSDALRGIAGGRVAGGDRRTARRRP